jgi:hypothetical protein
MIQPTTKSITFTAIIIIIITILTLTFPDIALNGFSQTINASSEYKTKLDKTTEIQGIQSQNTNSSANQKDPLEEIAMKVQLLPHENKYLKDWYQISNFAFVVSNSSKLCPSSNCEYKLENSEMTESLVPGERSLIGKFIIDTEISKELMNFSSIWKTVKEFEKEDETIQVIEGTLMIGNDSSAQKNRYKINGTLSTYSDNYSLELKGKK